MLTAPLRALRPHFGLGSRFLLFALASTPSTVATATGVVPAPLVATSPVVFAPLVLAPLVLAIATGTRGSAFADAVREEPNLGRHDVQLGLDELHHLHWRLGEQDVISNLRAKPDDQVAQVIQELARCREVASKTRDDETDGGVGRVLRDDPNVADRLQEDLR